MSKMMKQMMGRDIKATLGGVDSMVVIGFDKLDVESSNRLRTKLAAEDAHLRVIQNRVARFVTDDLGYEGLGDHFRGTTAIAFGGEGAIAISRVLVDWEKTEKNISLKGGYIDGETIDESGVRTLATIPDKDTLRSQILASIQGPMTYLARCFNGVGQNLVTVLKAIADKKQESGESVAHPRP